MAIHVIEIDDACSPELHDRRVQLTTEAASLDDSRAAFEAEWNRIRGQSDDEMIADAGRSTVRQHGREAELDREEIALRKALDAFAVDAGREHDAIRLAAIEERKALAAELRALLVSFGLDDGIALTQLVSTLLTIHPKARTLHNRATFDLHTSQHEVTRDYRRKQQEEIARLQAKIDAVRRQLLSRMTDGIPPAPPQTTSTGGFERRET